MLYKVIFFMILMSQNLYSKDFLVLRCRESGLFSVFQDVIHTLLAYDKSLIAGVKIDYRDQGLYYDMNYGLNWWEYYFEPINLGNDANSNITISYYDGLRFRAPLRETSKVLKKYIHLKPHMQSIIQNFKNTHFKNKHVIAIHYRGTDKYVEAGTVSYEKMVTEVCKIIYNLNKNYKIFVATDEQEFLNLMITKFGNKVCYYNESPRSGNSNPVHLDPARNPYKCGESAIIDCILLSNSNFLLRTESNLSHCAHYFNPNLNSKVVKP